MSSFALTGLELESIRSEVVGEPGFALIAVPHLGALSVTEFLVPHSRRPKFCGLLGTLMTRDGGYRACATVGLPRKSVFSAIREHTLITSTLRADLEIFNQPPVATPLDRPFTS